MLLPLIEPEEHGVWTLAATPEEREEVFRFRYAGYFADTRHLPGVDHDRQRVFLPHDALSTHILGRSPQGDTLAVGTATPADAPNIVPVWQELFQLERLKALGLEHIVIISRLVVLPDYRHSAFVGHFFVHLLRHCIEQGYRYAVHYCAPDMLPFYERLGYRAYGEARNLAPVNGVPGTRATEPGPLRIPLLLAPFDDKHLRRVHSLFREVPQGPPEDVERLVQKLPELTAQPLCAQSIADRKAALAAELGIPATEVERALPPETLPLLKRASLLHLRAGQTLCSGIEAENAVLVLRGRVIQRDTERKMKTIGPCCFVRTGAGHDVRMLEAGTLVLFHNLRLPPDSMPCEAAAPHPVQGA